MCTIQSRNILMSGGYNKMYLYEENLKTYININLKFNMITL